MEEILYLPADHDGAVYHYVNAGPRRLMHRHAELEVNLVLAGRATYLLGERTYDLRRHSQVWLFPGQNHLLIDQSADYAMWIVVFRPALLRRCCTAARAAPLLRDAPPGYFCRRLGDAAAARLGALCAELHAIEGEQHSESRKGGEGREDGARYNAGLAYALLSAWAAYLDADEGIAGSDVHPAVERAALLLHDETEPLGVDELARRAGLSASRLSRLFEEQMGVSLTAFRNRQRLERFLRLYGRGQRVTMLAAALDANFGSYAQFYRVFTRLMGCTPAEYRCGQHRDAP